MGLQYTPYCFLCNMLCGGGVNTTDAQIVMWISFKAPILVQYGNISVSKTHMHENGAMIGHKQ